MCACVCTWGGLQTQCCALLLSKRRLHLLLLVLLLLLLMVLRTIFCPFLPTALLQLLLRWGLHSWCCGLRCTACQLSGCRSCCGARLHR